MDIVQISPYPVYPPSRGAEHRSHGLVVGRGKEDTVTRYAAVPYLEKRSEPGDITNNYAEYWSRDLFSSVQGALLNQINAPRVWDSPILKYSPQKFNLGRMDEANIVMVDRPWLIPYVENKIKNDQILVYSSHNVETELYSHLQSIPIYNIIHDEIVDLEEHAITIADLTVAMSHRDKEIYEGEYGSGNSIYVAPAAGYSDQIAATEGPNMTEPELPFSPGETSLIACFVGNDHYPNVEAVEEILKIANLENLCDASVEFLIIGNVCTQFEDEDTPENIHLLGFVDSLHAYYAVSDIALNPIQSGSGVNIKMLEYFQYGLATISTPFGARGIDAEPGVHYLEADTDCFPQTLSNLSKDARQRQNIASNAKEIIQNELNWQSVSESLFQRFKAEL